MRTWADRGTTDAFAGLAPSPAAEIERALAEVQQIMAGPSVQARCLECGPSSSAAVTRDATPGLFALVLRWLWS